MHELDQRAAPTRLLRLPEVRQRTGLSTSSVYQQMKDGRFPPLVRIGVRTSAWCEDEVDAWIATQRAARPAGARVGARPSDVGMKEG